MFRLGVAVLVVMVLVGVSTTTAFAQSHVCVPVDQSTKTVIPGVTLTWDSSFRCANAPDKGTYEITVRVANAANSVEAVKIDTVRLSHTTPRPRGRGPSATAVASGLPLMIAPGETRAFSVSGNYTLVVTDEGKKANLHLQAVGQGMHSAMPFRLGINVHLRGPGARE